MNNPIKGPDGSGTPRYPTETEGGGKADFKDVLSRLLKAGPQDIRLRQGEGRDVPLDGGKTRSRMDRCQTALKEPKHEARGLWESVKAGLRSFGEMLGLISPKRPDLAVTGEPLAVLREHIGAFASQPAGFLRLDNGFSAHMRSDLQQRLGDGKVLRDLLGSLTAVKDAPSRELDFELAAMGREAAGYNGRLTSNLLTAVFGGEGKPSLAQRLPEGWLVGLREAAAEIGKSDLDPGQKREATRTLVKSAVFLRFVSPEIAKKTAESGTHPGLASAGKSFLKIVNGASLETVSPELQEVLGPLAQGFGDRLDAFIGELGIAGFGG